MSIERRLERIERAAGAVNARPAPVIIVAYEGLEDPPGRLLDAAVKDQRRRNPGVYAHVLVWDGDHLEEVGEWRRRALDAGKALPR